MIKFECNELIKKVREYANIRNTNVASNYLIEEINELMFKFIEYVESIDNIIDNILLIDNVEVRRSIFYSIGDVYSDYAKYLMHKNGYIEDEMWNFSKIEYEEEISINIISNLKKSIMYYEKNISDEKLPQEFLKGYKIAYSDLLKMLYIVNDYEEFEKYANLGIKLNSISMLSMLIKYYYEKEELDKAYYYFEQCMDTEITYFAADEYNGLINETNQILTGISFSNILFLHGRYETSLNVIEKTKTVLLRTKLLRNDSVINSKIENKIQELKNKLNELEIRNDSNKLLEKYFDNDVINLMSNDVKIYIMTSIEIFEYINKTNLVLDYSAALMPIMKGLEQILYDILVGNYLEYLRTKKNLEYNYIVDRFIFNDKYNNKKYLNKRVDRVEYGDAFYSVAKFELSGDKLIINKYFLEFCMCNGIEEENARNIIEVYARKLYKIKEQRNKVAHKNRVLKDDAEDCIKELLFNHINFIEFLYKNFNFCFNRKKHQ